MYKRQPHAEPEVEVRVDNLPKQPEKPTQPGETDFQEWMKKVMEGLNNKLDDNNKNIESMKEDNRTLREDSLKNMETINRKMDDGQKNMESLNKNMESLKEDNRDMNKNFESLKAGVHARLDDHNKNFELLKEDLNKKIDDTNRSVDALNNKIDYSNRALKEELNTTLKDISKKMDEMNKKYTEELGQIIRGEVRNDNNLSLIHI